MTLDDRRHAPATARNREPILAVLRAVLPPAGLVLEIASGTGEHASFFAQCFPALTWQPSDPDPEARASIDAWAAEAGAANLRPALAIDTAADDWGLAAADAILCVNLTHVAPWTATEGLMAGAGRLLPAGGPLVLYGPFMRGGRHTARSNAVFDASLRTHDPGWGVRDLDDVAATAEAHGLALDRVEEMPANNLTAVFRRIRGSL